MPPSYPNGDRRIPPAPPPAQGPAGAAGESGGRRSGRTEAWARAIWTGSISFGLVNVPVKAYAAVHDHDVHFNQLEKGTGARVRYEKVSDKTGKELEGDDIELGYKVGKGQYVVVDRDELEELRPTHDAHDRRHRLRRPRRHRPDLLRAHLLAGARRRGAPSGPTACWPRRRGGRAGRHRHGGHAQQAVPGRHPSRRRRSGHVHDALRRRGGAASRTSTDPKPAKAKPDAKEMQAGLPDHRIPGHRMGPEALPRHLHRRAP